MVDDTISRKPRTVQPQATDRLWFDPRVLALNTSIVQTDYTIAGNVNTLIAVPSIRRVMVGFFFGSVASSIDIAPWPDVDQFVLLTYSAPSKTNWINLFDFGPLLGNGWFARTSFPNTVRVIEVVRN